MLRKLFAQPQQTDSAVRRADFVAVAQSVLSHAPYPCGMDKHRLAELAEKSFDGKRLKVSEYPDGIDREYAKTVIGRVISWVRWHGKVDGYSTTSRFIEYRYKAGVDPCEAMRKMDGKLFDPYQGPLPRSDCWKRCLCSVRAERRNCR